MATTIEQQVALDEALVPRTKRLRIRKSNFRLPSVIQSKESTLQVVYDVLRNCPFFKAFLVTADVPKIYMQEFGATVYVHQYSIRFKLDNKKHIVDLETFRNRLHICPRIPGQSFDELPFEAEILEFLRDDNMFSTIKVVSRHQNTQQYGAILPIKLTNEDIRNTKAYKEYYTYASGEAAPKPKASARRKIGGFDSSTTPPTVVTSPRPTIAASPRLTAAAKGKQPAKAKSPSDPSELARTETQQLKIVLKRSRYETHISQHGGFGTDEGTGSKLGVPNVPSDDSEEEILWNSSDNEETNTQEQDRHDDKGDEKDESDDDEEDDGDDKNDDDDDNDEESDNEETREEESFDPIPRTPEDSEDDGNGEEDQGLRISEEERIHEEKEADELYRDQKSSSVSSFVTSMLNPISSAGVESIFATASYSVAPLPTPIHITTPSIIITITTASHPQIPPIPIPSEVIQNLPTFDSVFRFDERLKSLEATFSEYRQTNPFAEAVSNILGIVHQYMNQKLNEAVRVAVQIQTDRLRDSYQRENDEFLRTINDNIKRIIKEQVKSQVKKQVSRILPRIKEFVNAQLEAEVLTRSSHSSRTSYAIAADLSEMELKKILIEKIESAFTEEPMQTTSQIEETSHPVFETGVEDQPIVQTSQHPEWFPQPKKPPTPDRDWNKTLPAVLGSAQTWIKIEYHLEEVYKATTDQLDWINPEGQQYPHNLLQPIPLIPNNRGRRVIPFAHFINNDLEYLRGGASSRKYKTSVTKTKAVDYGNIKWIEDLVPRSMWIQEPINYDKHALWGVSYWGRKRQQFYEFTVNRESTLDVYSKRRIIAVTDLKIVEWYNYKHLDWISVCRDDDKIYKFKEGDFKRLRLQDIEDMLPLLVQGKLSNLTVEELFAFNVSLRMFIRSIVIQRCVKDL
uniref:Uncharacterized protein n=1 Tax=Tanacetum cinerariifolium TaxID=118510 RepID=A0A699ISP0_TANCI|nr:hypothetical protein [Tanacetum cinerariifolium]